MKNKNEKYKNSLIKNIDFRFLTKEEQSKIIEEIIELNFDNVNEDNLKRLKNIYENEIKLLIERKKNEFEKKLLGEWYTREKTIDDLFIFLLIICLIIVIILKFRVIILKFGSNINDLINALIIFLLNKITFLLNKIIFPHLLKFIILISVFMIYFYKKNFVYNVLDFILIWFKILTFQWLF